MSCHQGGCIIISKTVFILPFNALEADCMFYSDKPIGSNNEDMLNRKGFAKILARTLVHLESRDTFTVGLFGKWGSGKTSLVNMTLTEIESIQAERKTEDQIIVVHFEPWNFTDTNQLLTQFFIRLANEFQNKKDRTLTKLGKALEKYSDCKNQSYKYEQSNSDDFQHTPCPMVSDGKLRVDAGQFFCQPVRFFFVFHLGSKKLAYGRFENDGNFYQLFRIKNRHSGFP